MYFAIISDIHANLPALDAVLHDIDQQNIKQVYCLGDIVGYNSYPIETIQRFYNRRIAAIHGNHDLMVIGNHASKQGGPKARAAIAFTRRVLKSSEIEYLSGLPGRLQIDRHFMLVHSTLDNPYVYLKNDSQFTEHRRYIHDRFPETQVCFTGHSHIARIVTIDPDGRVRILAASRMELEADHFYFINPGSVGHPRHSDYRASYLIFNSEGRHVNFRRVRYPKKMVEKHNERYNLIPNLGSSPIGYHWRVFKNQIRNFISL